VARDLRIGVLGAGGFGLFALQQFAQVEGVSLIGMAGTHRPAAMAVAKRFGIPDIEDVDVLIARDDIDLVYIATPPFLHFEQGLQALKSGKHVISEKPLALSVEDAQEMVEIAREKGLVLVANLMQRYNPLYTKVAELIKSEALGSVLHGYLENYASDEGLAADHWFWDRSKSGGIFIEHGVHFFDMFQGWLGDGEVVAAQRTLRPGTDIEEQVNCTVRYQSEVLVSFYHGFTQPARLDRQEFRLVFELGEVTLRGWVPTTVHIYGVADENATRSMMDLFPGARLDVFETYAGPSRLMTSRHRERDVYQRIDIRWGDEVQKIHRYGELLRALLADQMSWISDPTFDRRVTEQNGLDSIRAAVRATELAASPVQPSGTPTS
jgi:predicted dehydrogenase